MKAALVKELGKTPVYADFNDPSSSEGLARIAVKAAALSHVTKGRASGRHYTAVGQLPFVPGIDGTGVREDGTRVYFMLPEAPFGAMAEHCVVSEKRCIPLPASLDDVTAAAIAIPGMSSWAALVERAKLVKGETVLVNGATGTSGRLAVQIARHLGASKVIATGRNADALKALQSLGADATIDLTQNKDALAAECEAHFRAGVGVVLDYLWGPAAEALLTAGAKAAADAVPIRFVQIGAISAPTIELPSAILRSSPIELMGSGIGSIPLPRIVDVIGQLLAAAGPAGFKIATKAVPLPEVEAHWSDNNSSTRIVFTTGH